MQTHVAVDGSGRRPVPGATAAGPTNPNATLEVTLKLRRRKEIPDLDGRPQTVMSRQQLEAEYGGDKADIDKVISTLTPFGLEVVEQDTATRSVRVSGTVEQMEKAFNVRLFDYDHADEPYRGRVGAVHVPQELAGIVEGVFGLDNRRVARRRRHPVGHGAMSRRPHKTTAMYKPAELAKHYNFPAGDGAGQTIGILEFGGGYFPSDLKSFCHLAGIATPPQVTAFSVDGTATNHRDGAEGEVMLDVEVAAGVCPKAHIVLYFAEFTEQGWIAAVDAAVHDTANNPSVLSISWGFAEDADIWTTQAMTQVNEALKAAALIGMTVCVAAGDDGSSDGITDGMAHADFPSSSPYVLAVGGTTIPRKKGNGGDIVWKEGDGLRAHRGGSTGGAVSAVFPRPSWQSAITIDPVNPGAIEGRVIPDLSANADWNASPYLLVVDGQAQPNGGTSAATPLVASMIALINAGRPAGKPVGYLTPVLYQGGANGGGTIGQIGCVDVTSGNNVTDKVGGFSAGPGYDAASGWGVPDGQKLAAAIP
jgi:kumamolisin